MAVDLAAEAKKAKDTMKALRASQMDKPPPVAMKLNKKTGQVCVVSCLYVRTPEILAFTSG